MWFRTRTRKRNQPTRFAQYQIGKLFFLARNSFFCIKIQTSFFIYKCETDEGKGEFFFILSEPQIDVYLAIRRREREKPSKRKSARIFFERKINLTLILILNNFAHFVLHKIKQSNIINSKFSIFFKEVIWNNVEIFDYLLQNQPTSIALQRKNV